MRLGLKGPGLHNPSGAKSGRRRSLFGRVFRGIGWLSAGPMDWLGLRGLSRGGSFLRDLSTSLCSASQRDPRFRTSEDRGFDLQATAFLHGTSALGLERRLRERRRQTAQIAYATFALGCVFLTGWVCEALRSPWTAGRIVLALEFLPFCALFFLLAFYNALLNFQIRIGRMASWREYLATSEPLWPQ
jgi:hypothetical protein